MRSMYDTLLAGASPLEAPASLHALVLDRVTAQAHPVGEIGAGPWHSPPARRPRFDAAESLAARSRAVGQLAPLVDPEQIVIVSPPMGAPGHPPPSPGPRSLERAVRKLEPSRDRGTLPAVLLGVLDILPRDPDALVLVVDAAAAARPPPPELVQAIAQIAIDPSALAWFSWTPGRAPGRFADGLALVAEARQLLRTLQELNPVWAEALLEAALDERAQERAFRMLPPADLELLALTAQRPSPTPPGAPLRRSFRRVAGNA